MLEFLGYLLIGIQVLFFLYFLVINTLYSFFIVVALKDIRMYSSSITRRRLRSMLSGIFYKPLSILVPACNEQTTISDTIKSLLGLRFPEYEIIVINDGSSDKTMDVLIETFHLINMNRPIKISLRHQPIKGVYISMLHPNLTVIDKENGGKADALNAGVNASQYPLLACIDADSVLETDSLLKATRPFVEDRQVVATGGIVRVLNGCTMKDGSVVEIRAPKGFIEGFQAAEYARGFLTGRTSWNFFRSLLIISGAFGVLRKDMVLAVNGFRNTVGEDMDIVVRMHKHCLENKIPYKIMFVPDPVCWTEVPSDLGSLLRQRNRWQRGLVESLWHNKKMFLNPRYGIIGMLGFPYFVVIEALGPIIEFVGYFSLILFFAFGIVGTNLALLFFIIAILWATLIHVGSVMLDNLIYKRYKSVGDLVKLSVLGLLEFFGYRQLIVMERFIGLFQFRKSGWGKAKRKGKEKDVEAKRAA